MLLHILKKKKSSPKTENFGFNRKSVKKKSILLRWLKKKTEPVKSKTPVKCKKAVPVKPKASIPNKTAKRLVKIVFEMGKTKEAKKTSKKVTIATQNAFERLEDCQSYGKGVVKKTMM
ncbi:hypothetical protein CDAR_390591 [Caerostris darwini]|uniref:Uncharacterized protein n=1 Tax=Caerostris darwini TaxID=1538125 RepID=A0AAV4T4Y4_9ARAC|nr:hypothetical protein CDAR_390591 [Caerostris darwini]